MRARPALNRVRSSGQLVLIAVRLVLAGGLMASWAVLLTRPQDTTTGRLLEDVRDGRAASVTVERPPARTIGFGFRVNWSTGLLHRWTTHYAIGSATGNVAEGDFLAQLRQAAAAAPQRVEIRTVPLTIQRSYTDWLAVFALLTVVVLIAGPDPAIATRWAWFWLAVTVPLAMTGFLLAEPWFARDRPNRPGSRRLTGGWALLLGLVIAGIAGALLPRFRGVLFTSGTGSAH